LIANAAQQGFQISGEFTFSPAFAPITFVNGFASGSLTSFSDEFQRLSITYTPGGPQMGVSLSWEYDDGGGLSSLDLGSDASAGSGDTISYDVTALHSGSNGWDLTGTITSGSTAIWDSDVTPATYTTTALIANANHFSLGISSVDADSESVSLAGATFTALAPEPSRALLLLTAFSAALLPRRRIS
jgi:hypothetical protein